MVTEHILLRRRRLWVLVETRPRRPAQAQRGRPRAPRAGTGRLEGENDGGKESEREILQVQLLHPK